MLLWILQQIIISVVLIVTVHYIYIFFKNNLTVPKTKDLVKKPTEQYQKIYNSINKANQENKSMKNDLKNFIQGLNKKNKNKNVEPSGSNYQAATSIGSYSNY
tara:strand:+ start:20354 stop:20662 length:309 start_codon:yes stop_codon:yes gene_type:complete